KRPIVVRNRERPALRGASQLERILFDVRDRAPHILGRIEKDLPTAGGPDRMISCSNTSRAQRVTAIFLKLLNHAFRTMFMFADQKVNVIEHYGAGIAGVAVGADA